ncbi:diadenylate cyclase CdaA [candidate division WOR-3 bacterium]|nr:diadenylate cyclase CdaA [candidate division WOR-3 bacterium]
MGLVQFITLDVIDIFLVSLIIYFMLLFFRGTKAISMLTGLIIVFLLGFLANILQLRALSWLLKGLETVWLIAFVIVFQPEIRSILSSIGKKQYFNFLRREREEQDEIKNIDEIVEACQWLSDQYTGALIVIERMIGLKHLLREDGVSLDATVSSYLLETIFSKGSPLHDGAVIIKNSKIIAAKTRLPWTNRYLGKETSQLGMRHRAAMGIAEETDAISIVVSEQTGDISIAIGKRLIRKIDADTLKVNLTQNLVEPQKSKRRWMDEIKSVMEKIK